MSRGVRNRGSSSPPPSPRRLAAMTVGTPTATTGMPSVRALMALRWLPTPLPGISPVSPNCTVAHSRSRHRAASASMAMTAALPVACTAPRSSSSVSMPVAASTPGASAATGVKPRNCQGSARTMCRVTSRLSSASGPTASAVMPRLPSPATSTGQSSPVPGSSARSSQARHSTARRKNCSSRRK